MDRDPAYLHDIIQACRKLSALAQQTTFARFERDEDLQAVVFWQLTIIGEACRAISADFKAQVPEVPWRDIVDLRNNLVHTYFRVDLEDVWSTVIRDIPALQAQLSRFDPDR